MHLFCLRALGVVCTAVKWSSSAPAVLARAFNNASSASWAGLVAPETANIAYRRAGSHRLLYRSDESSAQTVACGPPARPRRGSDQAFTESKRPRLSTLKRADQLNVNSKALESDDEECSRSRSALDRRGKLLPQGKNGSVGLSLESLAAAAFLAKKHTFKPLKLSVTRTKRQVR